eukprot:Opistho-2@7252
MALEHREHRVHRFGRAGHEQAAAGLRVAEQGLVNRLQAGAQAHLVAVGGPVAARGAGHHARRGEFTHALDHGHTRHVEAHRGGRAARHLQHVAGQAEAGDVGERVHAFNGGQVRSRGVELRGVGDHLRIALGRQRVLLQRGREHAHADRLAQDQAVAHLGVGVALDALGVHQAQRDQAVDGLDRVDGVAARDRDAGGAAHVLPAFEDLADGLGGQHVDGHAHERQRHDGRAAHGVHVADGVGGGDAAEVVRVVDDGHEEIGGGDQRLLVVELVHGGVVGGLDAHQQLLGHGHRAGALEDFAEHAGGDLAAAAAPVREAGEARLGGGGFQGCVHGGLRRDGVARAAGALTTAVRPARPAGWPARRGDRKAVLWPRIVLAAPPACQPARPSPCGTVAAARRACARRRAGNNRHSPRRACPRCRGCARPAPACRSARPPGSRARRLPCGWCAPARARAGCAGAWRRAAGPRASGSAGSPARSGAPPRPAPGPARGRRGR